MAIEEVISTLFGKTSSGVIVAARFSKTYLGKKGEVGSAYFSQRLNGKRHFSLPQIQIIAKGLEALSNDLTQLTAQFKTDGSPNSLHSAFGENGIIVANRFASQYLGKTQKNRSVFFLQKFDADFKFSDEGIRQISTGLETLIANIDNVAQILKVAQIPPKPPKQLFK